MQAFCFSVRFDYYVYTEWFYFYIYNIINQSVSRFLT